MGSDVAGQPASETGPRPDAKPPAAGGGGRIDWRGADLRGANMAGVDLEHADLRACDLRGVNFTSSNLRYADLRGASAQGACFQRASLYGAKMQGIEAHHADFRNCDLRLANLGGAYLEGAMLPERQLSPGEIADVPGTQDQPWDERLEAERKAHQAADAASGQDEQVRGRPPAAAEPKRGRGR